MKIIEVQFGKKKIEVVSGLIWHPIVDDGTPRAKIIAQYVERENADFKLMRGDDTLHIGLAQKAQGAQRGQLSCAAVVADTMLAKYGCQSMLVALQVPGDRGSFVLVSAHGGPILADGDCSGTADEIRVKLVADAAYGTWGQIICPAEWGVSNSEELTFESFFTPEILKNAKQWRLTETTFNWKKTVFPVGVAVVVVAASLFAGNEWKKSKAAAAAELVRLQLELEQSQHPAEVEIPKPWLTAPDAKSFTQACSNAFGKTQLAAGNWTLDGVVCEGGLLTATWKRGNGNAWISHLKVTHPTAIVAIDGQSASVAAPAEAAVKVAPIALPGINGLVLRYLDLSSRYGVAVRIDPPLAPPAPVVLPGQSATAAPTPAPTWAGLPIQVASSFDPSAVVAVLDYPGLRFTKIAYVVKAGAIQYQLTGVQYVRL